MKYSLTQNTKQFNGITLYQIKAEKDFGDVKKGDLGGWIEKESNLSQEGNCWVFDDALVSGNARVYGNASVYGNAQISGNAWVSGNARVYGSAQVYGNTSVSGNAQVSGYASVYGNAHLESKASFTRGWFIGGDDSGKITEITDKTGSNYWKKQYVLGDYKIEPIGEDNKKTELLKKAQELIDKAQELKEEANKL